MEMMKKSDSIGSTLTSHFGTTKTKRKNSVKKQKIVKGEAKIMIIMRIHWKLTIGTTEIFLKKKTALTKFLDQSNKRVYAGQMKRNGSSRKVSLGIPSLMEVPSGKLRSITMR